MILARQVSFEIARKDMEDMMVQHSTVGVPEGFEAQMEDDCLYAEPGFSLCPPYLVESEVCQTLRSTPGVHVESLSVHRIDGGVCLHGVIEIDNPSIDVEHVMNRMVVKYGPSAVCPISDSDSSFMWG